MKMTKEDYEKLKSSINSLFSITSLEDSKRLYIIKGYSMERFRWDCLHHSDFDTNRLYNYLNDKHIDTALRRITRT